MSSVTHSYARAFLEAAAAGYDVEGFIARGADLAAVILREARLKAFFATPSVPVEAKRKALEDLSRKAGLDAFGTRFFGLLLDKHRLLQAPAILAAIAEEADRASGLALAHVTVASPIDGAQQERIGAALARAVGRRVRLTTAVDGTILGGFIARVGSEVFDASVRRAIEQFQDQGSQTGET